MNWGALGLTVLAGIGFVVGWTALLWAFWHLTGLTKESANQALARRRWVRAGEPSPGQIACTRDRLVRTHNALTRVVRNIERAGIVVSEGGYRSGGLDPAVMDYARHALGQSPCECGACDGRDEPEDFATLDHQSKGGGS